MSETNIDALAGYGPLLEQIEQRIQTARTQATLAVNRELLTSTGTSGGRLRHSRPRRDGETVSSMLWPVIYSPVSPAFLASPAPTFTE